jgi:hypothetical protein
MSESQMAAAVETSMPEEPPPAAQSGSSKPSTYCYMIINLLRISRNSAHETLTGVAVRVLNSERRFASLESDCERSVSHTNAPKTDTNACSCTPKHGNADGLARLGRVGSPDIHIEICALDDIVDTLRYLPIIPPADMILHPVIALHKDIKHHISDLLNRTITYHRQRYRP